MDSDSRDSISNWIIGADNIDEGGEERENMSVLRRDKVRQPTIVTPRVCKYMKDI